MVGRIDCESCLEPLGCFLKPYLFFLSFYLQSQALPTTYYVKQEVLLSVASATHLFTTSLILDLHRKTIDIFLTVGYSY